jgi:hypothetical protein
MELSNSERKGGRGEFVSQPRLCACWQPELGKESPARLRRLFPFWGNEGAMTKSGTSREELRREALEFTLKNTWPQGRCNSTDELLADFASKKLAERTQEIR